MHSRFYYYSLHLIPKKLLVRVFFGRRSISIPTTFGLTALDLGANVGDVSIILLRLGFNVIAFEPHPECAQFIRKRLAKFIASKRLILNECAILSESAQVKLLIAKEEVQKTDSKINPYDLFYTQRSSLIQSKHDVSAENSIDVSGVSIEAVLNEVGFVHLIKMDIEGGEYDIIERIILPHNINKWGVCLVETHAHKITGLKPKHDAMLDKIKTFQVESKFDLDWI